MSEKPPRIKGVNSDYVMQNGAVAKKNPLPADLEMRIFICPFEQPSALESEGDVCIGEDSACPETPNGDDPGHALLHLSANKGVRLVADGGSEVRVHQNNDVADAQDLKYDPEFGQITLRPAAEMVGIYGSLRMETAGQVFTITPSASGIAIAHENGAEVILKPNGDLDLITKNNTGTVNIQGNLEVSGTLTRQGQVI